MTNNIKILYKLLNLSEINSTASRCELFARIDIEYDTLVAASLFRKTIATEQEAASAIEAPDAAVESFAVWLPQGRFAQTRAQQLHRNAAAETAAARARFELAHAMFGRVQHLLLVITRARRVEGDRKMQSAVTVRQPSSLSD